MDVVTAEEMRAFDRDTIERLGIPAIALMENAGRAIAEEVIAPAAAGQVKLVCLVAGRGGWSGSGWSRSEVEWNGYGWRRSVE